MKNKILSIGLLAIATALFIPEKAQAQATNLIQQNIDQSQGNFTFKSATIIPSQTENPTNSFKVLDTTGTNVLMISPTNNQFIVRADGSNSFSVLSTNVVVTNSAGQTHTMFFKNGILVSYQ